MPRARNDREVCYSIAPMKAKKDRIFLIGLETRCVIGIFGWERRVKQKVLVDLGIPADGRRAARRDRIEDAVNYKAIAKRLLAEIPKTRFRLIESLSEFIAGLCLKEFNLPQVTVRVSKPGAIRHAQNVGIEITRRRSEPALRRRGPKPGSRKVTPVFFG